MISFAINLIYFLSKNDIEKILKIEMKKKHPPPNNFSVNANNTAIKMEPVEVKEELPEDEPSPLAVVHVKNEPAASNPFPGQLIDGNIGLGFPDILELTDRELAKRIFQAETGIKYLYFVLAKKTDQLRYLVKAKKFKRQFMDEKAQQTSGTAGTKARGRPSTKSLDNCDPSRADVRTLKRVLMSDKERAEQREKRKRQQREKRMRMTAEELEEEKARARRKLSEIRARMSAEQLEEARRKRAFRDREYKKRKRMEKRKKKDGEGRMAAKAEEDDDQNGKNARESREMEGEDGSGKRDDGDKGGRR